ncbi:hypothetical protein CH063_05992 [Colletotrichum higginsianum]|uniref:Uncharacterized protein n=2 Tax=Colletotrichum higginsianum TaxID=80884 RepID=H1V0Z2_COLHI|nr:hypothetical protein CH63R_04845 [Colletotrichum higginsianum IMI 349063]OBR12549.1 hypothetical protein CH63R_04845 [Colletotrichum higginsianum IMI 349063]TIC98944.1 hypothetical protein CH35J_005352 [Colletotrichum higginsianum]GJC94222.1 hypothetical protein ColKHC_03048 [Colletotrichum higginsianum]CCF33893.1 hypothetical protein CH063_05992 [Colletotrichum higginsianum]
MSQSYRKKCSESSTSSRDSRRSSESCDSFETYESQSTTPTSYYASTEASASVKEARTLSHKFQPVYEEDISPSTSNCLRSSVDTFDSTLASDDEDDDEDNLELKRDYEMDGFDKHQEIPPLPAYCRDIVDTDVRPSTPQDFAKLFPSMNRLSICHDDLTPDGNMNLRVDTVAPGRRPYNIQLFHLRMYDLGKREFSLRRYCRDSGREVCNSKRKYLEETVEERPTLQRSVSSAIKTLSMRKPLPRTNSGGPVLGGKGKDVPVPRPQSSASSSRNSADEPSGFFRRSASFEPKPKARPVPSNAMKLEFSNYARVDVERRGSSHNKRYEFQWWGHKYQWKRVIDKNLGVVSFHLVKDGNTNASDAVAHIVPETRSPNQVVEDESAGGWVPPCHMWISDRSVLDAVTDVADVIVATGLMALVDDCIKHRWQTKKIHRIPVPLTSRTVDVEYVGPRAFVQHLFQRRASDQISSPLRQRPIPTY